MSDAATWIGYAVMLAGGIATAAAALWLAGELVIKALTLTLRRMGGVKEFIAFVKERRGPRRMPARKRGK